MNYVRRIALLRFVALVAIAVSAVLTVDHIRPGRDFCPLAEACAAARNSALGSIGDVPTSMIGMGAFGLLLLLTLLPLEWARPLLKPAGAFAALAGLGFIAYQRLALGSYCPLCLVADSAGFVAGVLTITWPNLPVRRSGRNLRFEGGSSRLAWTMAGILAAIVPFAIPRAEDPGWVEITPLAANAFDEDVPAVATRVVPPAQTPATPPAATDGPDMVATPAPDDGQVPEDMAIVVDAHVAPPAQTPATPPAVTDGPDVVAAPAPDDEQVPEHTEIVGDAPVPPPETDPETPASSEPAAAIAPVTPRAPKKVAAPVEVPAPLLVEYLNAFCPHCRATHKRLRDVMAETGVEIRVRRVYTWADKTTPDWARACAYAASVGLEDRMFEELLAARRPSRDEIEAAAKRAGVDLHGLRTSLDSGEVPARLARDKRLAQQAGLRKLPTIDIGRRRLMGSQSKAELRDALLAAAGAE